MKSLPLILLASLIAGCAVSPTEAKRMTSEIRTRASAIHGDAKLLASHVDKEGKAIVQRIDGNAAAIGIATDEADKIIDAAAKYAQGLESKTDKLSGSIGVKLERAAWISLYLYIAGWIISHFVVPALGPGSKLSSAIVRFFPAMNLAAWARDLRKPDVATVPVIGAIVTK